MKQQQLYVIRIGKAGITPTIIDEIKRRLKNLKIVKVRFLSTAMTGKDKKKVTQDVADTVGAKVLQRVGFTVVLKQRD